MSRVLMLFGVDCYMVIVKALISCRAPSWLINFPQLLLHIFVPADIRVAAFGAWLRRYEAKEGGAK